MFGWFTSWLEKRRLREKALFRYHDGKRWRYGDPWALHRKLFKDDSVDVMALSLGVDSGDAQDSDKFLAFVSRIFGLHRWDDAKRTGLIDAEVRVVFDNFCDYVLEVKKNFSQPQTTMPCSDGKDSPTSTPPLTSASLDCGSITVGLNCDAQPAP